MAKTGSAMPSANAPVKQHEAFLEETKTLLHPGNFQVCGRSIEMYSLGKYLGKVLVFFGLFFQPFYNHLGCDHETTFEPTVRTNRCSSCLTLLNASRQARSFLIFSSCFPFSCLPREVDPSYFALSQESHTMQGTSSDCV